jgi:hypothetical protein
MMLPLSTGGRIAAVALLFAGLIVGCDNGSSGPPFVLGYSYIDTTASNDILPWAAFDGTNFLVVYDDVPPGGIDHDIIGALVDQNGNWLTYLNVAVSPADDRVPQVAFDGTNYLVVYQEGTASHDIMGVFVSPGGLVGTPFVIDASVNDDTVPTIAFDGTDYLVAFQRVNGLISSIIGALVDPAGNVLVGSPFPIDTSANVNILPAATSNGTTGLVAYQRASGRTADDILGALVDPTGSATPPAVTLINVDVSQYDDQVPAVASDGTNYLVVYQEYYPSDRDIRGALITSSGQLSQVGIPIDTAINIDDFQPRVAWGGSRYLVAYTETFSSYDHDILGARLTSSGTVQKFAVPIDTSPYDDFNPSVAFGAASFLVPYQETVTTTNNNIIGALVSS